jgi:FtsP/CotA-like multicopper oxidase with cupredoxin domain
MRTLAITIGRSSLVLALCAVGLAAASTSASAAGVTIELCAAPSTATLSGSQTVPIWGFGVPSTSGDCTTATPTLPGPQIEAHEGDDVTFVITNALPAGHTLSIEIPGLTLDPGPTDAAPGASVSLGASNVRAGTYLYQSGGDAGRQEAMGLAGLLIVRPNTAGRAYDTANSAYNVEAPLVLGAVDPDFNQAPDTFDMHQYHATYWLINGKAYPDTTAITAAPGQRVLLRYVNAGFDNTSMTLLGLHALVIARSGRTLPNPLSVDTDTIPAGSSEDAIAVVPSGSPPSPSGYPIFNRQLHLTNGDQQGPNPTPTDGGGMLTFIHS